MIRIHATAIAINNQAVLLRGPSGCGKSDLALRMIEQGAKLISDDYTELSGQDNLVTCAPPNAIAGKMEVREVGLISMDYVSDVPLTLLVDLVPINETERMPEPRFEYIEGQSIPVLRLAAFAESTPAKIRLWLSGKKG